MNVTTCCKKNRATFWVSKCNRDRWIGAAIVPTKGGDEFAVAELNNELAILALRESAATALKLAGVIVKTTESALCDSQSN